ncbi:hypothetical protein [Chryseobacterium gregarium]|uniref:hypothetical protein n=1 Tax=Chryseobacterium gregarium TaxID=456299 RepID=UPI001E4126B5|nr:hypothetical protein [Chryseobacterium gregarium]
MKYKMFLIFSRFSGKKNISPKKMIFKPVNANAISAIEPPYCLKMLFGRRSIYRKKSINNPKMICPYGFLYFELDKNRK